MNSPQDDWTLGEVRDWLGEQNGVTCPCCERYVKTYRRTLPNATARVMIKLWHLQRGREYVFLPPVLDTMKGTPHQGGYGTYGHHWGLLQQMPGVRDDGSNRVGYWRLSHLGREFVEEEVTVPKFAHIHNGRRLYFSGPDWSIRDALGSKFNYDDLMAG